jgi:hypothetical protein
MAEGDILRTAPSVLHAMSSRGLLPAQAQEDRNQIAYLLGQLPVLLRAAMFSKPHTRVAGMVFEGTAALTTDDEDREEVLLGVTSLVDEVVAGLEGQAVTDELTTANPLAASGGGATASAAGAGEGPTAGSEGAQ